MISILFDLDLKLFLFINHFPHFQILDLIALALSGVGAYGLIWFLLGFWLFIREEKKDHWFFLSLFPSGLFCLWITEWILKPGFGRLRPAVDIGAIIIGTDLNSYSFPSGHAAIAFALAEVLSDKEPKWRIYLFILASLIALSRVYLGVHYPLDIIAGALLGWGIGKSFLLLSHNFIISGNRK